MQVIGVGFGRTGTTSLQKALEILGFGPCYHMNEVRRHPGHVGLWTQAAQGLPVRWPMLMHGFTSTVDWPGCAFARDFLQAFPQARFILTVRPFEAWYRSTRDTIYASSHGFPMRLLAPWLPGVAPRWRMVEAVIWEGTFQGRFLDPAFARQVYEQHVADMKALLPLERLLVFHVQEGWEPLCAFLQVPVPAVPFPHLNDSQAFRRRLRLLRVASGAILLTPPLLAGAFLYPWLKRNSR